MKRKLLKMVSLKDLFSEEEVELMGEVDVVKFGEKYPQLCEYYMTELDLDY